MKLLKKLFGRNKLDTQPRNILNSIQMSNSEQRPSIGRIVAYVPQEHDYQAKSNGAKEVPAIIVRTWEENDNYQNDEVNLRVFTDGEETLWRTSVPYDADGAPGTWHWPTKVERIPVPEPVGAPTEE